MIVETLKKSDIFSTLKEEELKKISPLFDKREFTKDEYIFFEGDPSDWLYIASQNRVKIVKHTLAGKNIILEIKSPGEIFCCAAVLDKRPYPESAQVMESASVIRISRRNLDKIMEEYPNLKLRFAKYSSDMLRDAHEMLKNIATEKVEKRIASLLLKLSEKSVVDNTGYKSIDFTLTRQEIAEMAGTTVETCIRIMSKFQKDGVITSSNKRILVKVELLKKILEHQ
ncbi:MAG: Crp/Fnr family transcriptional regulator [Thermodesulfovibrionia bacterium]|nr:Crp/Fnr family transcriptional regulator [Thermodesulfovibrionia bacterium]MCK5426052.1 Crp/Fnr family transcriptional regulator [Thermodesulfovibrionia bacterium]